MKVKNLTGRSKYIVKVVDLSLQMFLRLSKEKNSKVKAIISS